MERKVKIQALSTKGLAVARAYCQNKINNNQVHLAINNLPCFVIDSLRPGGDGDRNNPCDGARIAIGQKKIEGDFPPIPNSAQVFPLVCLNCPVFAPAISQLAILLPRQRNK